MGVPALIRLGHTAVRKCVLIAPGDIGFCRSFSPTAGPARQWRSPEPRHFRQVRKVEADFKPPHEFQLHTQKQLGPNSGRHLRRAVVFAFAFGGATFIGATICEYERIRSQTFKGFYRHPFHGHFHKPVVGWRNQMKNWWDHLTEGQKIFYFICYANVLVFLAWKVPKFRPTMMKYFTSNPANSTICWPMLFSTFSHYNLWHLAANMWVLHSFSSSAVAFLGQEHFVAFYLTCGVFSSLCSVAYKMARNIAAPSLGASGAIMGVLAMICTAYPENRLSIVFLPQFTFSGGSAIKALIATDTLGCLMGWKVFDHAAHLGGALFGIFWHQWGVEHIWRKRAPVLTYWHDLRSSKKSN